MFDIIIKSTHHLTQAENERIDEVSNLAYAGESGPGPQFDRWASSDFIVLGLLDGHIASLVGLLLRQIEVGNRKILVAGLGGVATHPDYQRRGFAGLLMKHARDYMRDEMKVPFGMLVCSPHREAYYHSLGWQTISEPMLVETSHGKLVWPEKVMVLPLQDQVWPPGPVDTCGFPW